MASMNETLLKKAKTNLGLGVLCVEFLKIVVMGCAVFVVTAYIIDKKTLGVGGIVLAIAVGVLLLASWFFYMVSAMAFNQYCSRLSAENGRLFDKEWEKVRDTIKSTVRTRSGEIFTPTKVRHHYAFMGLPDGSDLTAVKARYHYLMRGCHPDLVIDENAKKSAQDRTQKLTAAYKEIRDFLRKHARQAETDDIMREVKKA